MFIPRDKKKGGESVGFILEIFRIVLLMFLMGAAMSVLLKQLYLFLGFSGGNGFLMGVAIFLWLFVMYRNKWQFAGWYKGRGRERLPRWLARTLLISAVILAVFAPFVDGSP